MAEETAHGAGPRPQRATRTLRIVLMALLVLGIEWRMANPVTIAADPELWPLPYSMLFLCLPFALGVWAFESTGSRGSFKSDALWSVLSGTLAYVALSVLGRF